VSQDGEELLEFGRSPRPRWVRISALVALVVAVAVGVVLRGWPHASDRVNGQPTSTSTYLVGPPPVVGPSGNVQPWPTAPAACGGDTDLAIVSSTPVGSKTGVRLMVGGSALRTVDFDSGRSTILTGLYLRSDEFVIPATTNLAVLTNCTSNAGWRVVRVDAAGHATAGEPLTGADTYLIVQGANAWSVSVPDDPAGSALLTPVGGGATVRLPAGFSPAAIVGSLLVGNLLGAPGADSRDVPLVLVDAATGQIRQQLGMGAFLAAGKDLVLWTVGCRVGSGQPCQLNTSYPGAGVTRGYQLARPTGFAAGVVSPDGQEVAFLMERSGQDPRYDQGHPIPPQDVVIMHLDGGQMYVVPDVEVPAKSVPGLAFSADGNWLVIALNAGDFTRLLAWQPRLEQPYESAPVAGAGAGAPSIVALP
jgi:hypothetical protein